MNHRLNTSLGELLGGLAGVEEGGVVGRDDDGLPALLDTGSQGVVVGDLEADPHREGDLAALGDGGDRQRAGAVAGQHVDADAVDLGGQASHEGTGGNVLGEGYGPVLAVVGMNRLPGDVSGIPHEDVVVADVVDEGNGAHEHRCLNGLGSLIDDSRRGRVVARVQVCGVLRPDDHVEVAGADVVGQLPRGLSVVAGHLQGTVEGVLEVGGHVSLDGPDANGAVLGAGVQRQRPRRKEQGRGECCGDEDRDGAALNDGSSRVRDARRHQCHQQAHPGAADIGRCRQDGGIGHGEGQTPEGKTSQGPHRAQLLDPRPQQGEGQYVAGSCGYAAQQVPAAR